MVKYKAYDLVAGKKVDIIKPKQKTFKTKRGATVTMVMGTSPITGNKVSRIISRK